MKIFQRKNWNATTFTLLLMLLPGTLLALILKYLPMGGVLLAFKSFHYSRGGFLDSFWHSPWVGLWNFKFLFASPTIWTVIRNTLLYNITFIILGTVLALAVAISLSILLNKRLAKLYQTCFFLPYFLSWVVVSYLAFSFLSVDKGVLNSALKFFGMPPVHWYSESAAWPYILVFANLWKNFGYSAVIYLAAIVSIDKQYYEAAEIDGASKWQQIRYVTLPHLKPLITVLTLLAVGNIFSADFGLFYQLPLNAGALSSTTEVIDTYVYRSMIKTGDIGMNTAAGLYQAVIGFILLLTVNKIVKKVDKDNAMF